MRALLLYLTTLFVAVVLLGAVSTATAAAVPQCTNTTPTTTLCERPGNAQINTSPGVTNDGFWGWPWWGSTGITIDLGGGLFGG